MSKLDQIYGFKDDCSELIQAFISQKNSNFKNFCNEWKRMNFQYIFFGYSSDHEMAQFLDDAMIVVKHALLNANGILGRIGGLYLMYAIYFKQPTKQYCKFRFTLEEWQAMNCFYDELGTEYDQARLIFWKLLQGDAMRFVEAENEYGFETFMHKDNSKRLAKKLDFKKINSSLNANLSILKNEKTGLLPALEILQVGYNEMKEHLDKSAPRKGLLPSTNIIADIKASIDTIESNFKLNTSNDKLRKCRKILTEEDSANIESEDSDFEINDSRKRDLKRKGFQNSKDNSENSGTSVSTRAIINESEDFIQIVKPVLSYSRNKRHEIDCRTVKKQLIVPDEGQKELETTIKIEQTKEQQPTKSLPLL